jgi:porin
MRLGRTIAAAALVGLAHAAVAQTPAGGRPEPQAGAPETSDKPSQPPPSIATSLGPAGDPGGSRSALEKAGVVYSLTYIGEVLGNVSGGMRRGSIYEGRLDLQVDADLQKLAGWEGATIHAQAFQIHGHGLSRYYLGNLMTASGIEALPSTRLFELWLEQSFADGKAALRAGQLAADTEFLTSQYGGLFVNATFGWPAITGTNLPSGGPAYPLATPGARLKLAPVEGFTLLAAVFNGDPAGPGPGDPQRDNRHGLEFRTKDPAFAIAEAQLAYNQGKDAAGLPGTVKVGAWRHLGRFDDQRFDPFGMSLADPAGSGLAARLRGNGGAYAVVDQMLYRVPGTADQGLAAFARVSANPADRNLIDFYADGGFTWKGLIPGREDDTFGVGFGYARISRDARALDVDAISFTGVPMPVRSSEALIEVTYQAQVVPGWTVQPDFQYVFRPGGNVANPRDPSGEPIKNAAVFGLRTTIRY